MTEESYVYFVTVIERERAPVKIGCTKTPLKRLEFLAEWSPYDLMIAATIPGNLELERKIQECFAKSHMRHEWFEWTPRLHKLMADLRDGVPVERAIDLDKPEGSLRPKNTGPRNYNDVRRMFNSYNARVTFAREKISRQLGCIGITPDRISRIMRDWSEHRNDYLPPAEQFRELERYLSDPVSHYKNLHGLQEAA